MAIESQGVVFYWSSTTAASTLNVIGEVTGFSGPGGNAAVIDVTNLLSTAKEKMVGLRDEGQLTLDLNFVKTDVGQSLLITDRAARNKRNATIKFTDTAVSVANFDAYCLGFSISGAVDDKISANAVIEITDAVTWV